MEKTIIRRKGGANRLEQVREGEMEYLIFPSLQETGMVDHLISTRLGGVSRGDFSSMNLSYTRGDDRRAVDENFRRIASALGRETEDFVCSQQTHTVNIRKVTEKDRGKGVVRPPDYADVDGLVTDVEGIVLSTFYADCVPLLLVDPIHRAIGLSHSGWRGTAARMGARTLEAMSEWYGTRPEEVTAAVGPSICKDCYEVGEDVASRFREAFPDHADVLLFSSGKDKWLLDLWEANRQVLLEAGVREERIAVTDICTCCNPGYLFSHRASGGRRGNIGAFLSIRPGD